MKRFALLPLLLAAAVSVSAQEPASTSASSTDSVPVTPIPIGAVVTRSTTIQLGLQIYSLVPLGPARPPVTVAQGTRLTLIPPALSGTVAAVEWYKDGQLLSATGATFEIAAVTTDDSGRYSARVRLVDENGPRTFSSDSMAILVSHDGARLLNSSCLVRINAAQRSVISGFVIEGGPGPTLMLVRAIGPTLQSFGVGDALVTPQVRVIDGRTGATVRPTETAESGEPALPLYPSLATATKRVGAFAVPAGAKDIAALYALSAGSYSIIVESGDGGSGQVLLESYEVPY